MIENTQDSVSRLAFLAAAFGSGGDRAIEKQEQAGQNQLVNSEQLPADMRDGREAFEALGFTFGQPEAADPLFLPATLPEGWTRKASDHPMWSHLLDEHGRQRVTIFYKAAFYDRHARMSLVPVQAYLDSHIRNGGPLITDETWATPAAITKVCHTQIPRLEKEARRWSEDPNPDSDTREWADQATRAHASYIALLARFEQG
ncbi:hypothetical protein [Streptomyces sp. NPDC088752]|uniref:hypothetical protein n=1 Tax=Streptomyces sp. NPDC088752 TaxID=3154963 RepID=UPI003447A48B